MLFFTSDYENLEKSPLSNFDKNAVFLQLYLAMKRSFEELKFSRKILL